MANPKERKVNFRAQMSGARAVITNLNSISRALDVTQLAATKTFSIDKQIKNVAIQIGASDDATKKMTDSVLGLSNATGLSTDTTSKLVTAMAAAGMSVDSLDKSMAGGADTFSTLSDNMATNLEMMGELVGRHGITAAAAVKTSATLANMGESFSDLADDVTQWQKIYKVPGMIGQIPAAVGFAEKSITRFGRLVVGDGKEIVATTLKTGATFAKVYGVDIAQAIQMASQNQEHFMGELASASDVFLGLGDSFGPLSNALMESGMQMDQVQSMMQKGQDDPLAFADSILQMEEQMRQTYGPEGEMFVKRFHQNVLRNSSDQVKLLLEEEHARDRLREMKAKEAMEAEKLGSSRKSFSEMTTALREVGATAVTTFKNLAMLGKTIFGLMFADELTGVFNGLHETVKSFNVRVRQAALDMKEWMGKEENKALVKRLQSVGKTLAIVSAATAGVAASLGALVIPFTTMKGLLLAVPGAGSAASKVFGLLGKGASLLARKVLLPLTAIAAVGAALNDFGAKLNDPTLTSGETFVKGVQSFTKSGVDLIDGFLMGIPTKITKLFFPEMRGKLSDGINRMFNRLLIQMKGDGTKTLSQVFDSLKTWAGEKVDKIWEWMSTRLAGWKESARDIGGNIGRALGSLTKWAFNAIKPLFSPATWKRGWKRVVAWWNGEGGSMFSESLQNIFWGGLDLIGTFAKSFAEEFFLAMGSSFAEVKASLGFLGAIFANTFDTLKTNIGDYMTELGLSWKVDIYKGMYEPVAAFSEVWNSIKDSAAEGLASIATTAMAGSVALFTNIKKAIVDFKYSMRLIDAEEADRQKKALDDNERQLIQSVVGTADAIKAKIRGSSVSVEAFTADITAAQNALNQFTDAEAKAKRQTDLQNRVAGRTQAAERALSEAGQAGNALRDKRDQERLKRISDAAAAEQARKPIVDEIRSILEVAEKYRKQAADSGNMGVARNIDARIYRIEEALEYAQLSSDPSALQQYLTLVKGLVGDQVVGEATRAREASGGTEGAYVPPASSGSAYASAPERAGAAPANTTPAPQDVNVNVGGRTVAKLEVSMSPEDRDHLRTSSPAEISTVIVGGQV